MMKVTILICFMLAAGRSPAQQQGFQWLLGNWKLDGKEVYETWRLDDKQILRGRSFKIKDGDTLVTETISLMHYQGGFHYIPDVSGNQPPIDFNITSSNDSTFVAENPQHDFPKKITYRYARGNHTGRIQATIEGNGKSISYSFTRME